MKVQRGYRQREAAGLARSKRRLVSDEIRAQRAAMLGVTVEADEAPAEPAQPPVPVTPPQAPEAAPEANSAPEAPETVAAPAAEKPAAKPKGKAASK